MGWDYPDPRDMALKIYQLCTDEKLWKSHFDWRIVPDEKELLPFRKEFVDLHKEDFVRKDKKNWMCRTCDHVARIDEKCWHQ